MQNLAGMGQSISIFWFRRDLRFHDNQGLFFALRSGRPVLPLFIFDRNILDELEEEADPRVQFIHQTVAALKSALEAQGSSLVIRYGKPIAIFKELLAEYDIASVYTNRDYEPYARKRDGAVADLLASQGVEWHTFKDHVYFEAEEVLKADQTPYTVFTPYGRRWKARMEAEPPSRVESEGHLDRCLRIAPLPMPTLEEMGFCPSQIPIPSREVSRGLIRNYHQTRNFPGVRGTSRLGIHFRFGTISIRQKVEAARSLNTKYLNELIWRDFYAQILAHFPHVAQRAFRPEYDFIAWRDAPEDFERWCKGITGYPLVDAGMRELNQSGFMHNRVRMVTASFLTKHLLIDWRLGEAYFAKKLLDYDLASNNGGWQWAAGTGTDAAPYFRIFNPTTQLKKFDPDLKYVRQWIPEYGTANYPEPMVDHKQARTRCLSVYKEGIARGRADLGIGQ